MMIAILKINTKLYYQTQYILDLFYPSVVNGGIIIIENWNLIGVRHAFEEFFSENGFYPKMQKIENSEKIMFVKTKLIEF